MRKELLVDSMSSLCQCSCESTVAGRFLMTCDNLRHKDLRCGSKFPFGDSPYSKTENSCHRETLSRTATYEQALRTSDYEQPFNRNHARVHYVPVLCGTSTYSHSVSTLQTPSPKVATIVPRNPSHEPRLYFASANLSRSFARMGRSVEMQFVSPRTCVTDERGKGADSLIMPCAKVVGLPHSYESLHMDSAEKSCKQIEQPAARKAYERNTQLYKFLIGLLEDGSDHSCVIWIDRTRGIFRITDSNRFAKLWGEVKLNPTMNYEKLARSFRHYYQKGILEGYSGGSGNGKRKLLYKFSREVMDTCVYNK